MTPAVFGLGLLGAAALLSGRLHELLHLLQLEHYEISRLRVWIARRSERVQLAPAALVAGGGGVLVLLTDVAADVPSLAIALLFAGLASGYAIGRWRRPQAKPLVFTPRARRLGSLALLLGLATVVAAAYAGAQVSLPAAIAAAAATTLLSHVFADALLAAANLVLSPVQGVERRRFVKRARGRLRAVSPRVVGITGSYGKTTTKACVAAVAGLRGPAYPTPASFNSFLGVVRAINEGLDPRHRTFVVEMGAYRRGDVAALCELVQPTVGILTTVGPAHLERFGSLEAIEVAKGELAEALPPDGRFITRAEEAACQRIAERAGCPVDLFATEPHPDALVWAEEITLEEGRTRFELCIRRGASVERAPVKARLLGAHNVANLLAAATFGVESGVAADVLARVLGSIEPPAHRLAPIVNHAAGIVVIDDAYNANPAGAAAALGVLAAHPARRRLLVTPGLVELGDREDEENRKLGERAAAVCDVVVLVGGERTRPIREGLQRGGFDESGLRLVGDSSEAAALLATTTRSGDVVLFENDLPDLYSRA
ncbi:MAG: UDP-N-acetylmuramoyl-tripeptide--D-alanyl-D-alanine ligase [Thermoleophilaceae bacterium]|nr:UDP-N-acetylmuramoyl-tripeptide--D-alanyl-D-alanine ligase [Thermoleophilaceae bacterium]